MIMLLAGFESVTNYIEASAMRYDVDGYFFIASIYNNKLNKINLYLINNWTNEILLNKKNVLNCIQNN